MAVWGLSKHKAKMAYHRKVSLRSMMNKYESLLAHDVSRMSSSSNTVNTLEYSFMGDRKQTFRD